MRRDVVPEFGSIEVLPGDSRSTVVTTVVATVVATVVIGDRGVRSMGERIRWEREQEPQVKEVLGSHLQHATSYLKSLLRRPRNERKHMLEKNPLLFPVSCSSEEYSSLKRWLGPRNSTCRGG